MAVKDITATMTFQFTNGGRTNVTFPHVNNTSKFSTLFWVRLEDATPVSVWGYIGTDGSQLSIHHDGVNWYWNARIGLGPGTNTQGIHPIQVGRWACIAYTKENTTHRVYYGSEADTPSETVPVTLLIRTIVDQPMTYDFNSFHLAAARSSAITNFKFWKDAILNQTELEAHSVNWSNQIPAAVWVTPLRHPGDIADHAIHYVAPTTFAADHEWDVANTTLWTRLSYHDDPAYLTKNSSIGAWIYPNPSQGTPDIFYNPGVTPRVYTTFKAPQFYSFQNRGAIPATTSISIISYFGHVSHVGTPQMVNAVDVWGLYKDEHGVIWSRTDTNNYKFNSVTGIVSIFGPITLGNMFAWQFGAQFSWNPEVPPKNTSTGHVTNIMLVVEYIGDFTPVVTTPDMSGLFVITKSGVLHDTYNAGLVKRIPSPTIRTAFIGE